MSHHGYDNHDMHAERAARVASAAALSVKKHQVFFVASLLPFAAI